jgi:glyoxylase-like metal-dependent hydrolase (beta-lactamase superfamily II)
MSSKKFVKVEKIHTNNFTLSAAASKTLGFRVIPVATLEDNYAYLIVDPNTGKTAVVDPAEPDKVTAALKREKIPLEHLTHVLTTVRMYARRLIARTH